MISGRVVVWRDEWLPPSETFIREQVSALSRWSARPMGLYPTHNSPDAEVAVRNQRTASALRRIGALPLPLRQMARRIASERTDLIHAHFGTGGITILPVAQRLQLPLVVTFHGFDATRLLSGRTPASQRYMAALPRLFDYAARAIAVSEFIAERLEAAGAPADKINVLPIGSRDFGKELSSHVDGRAGIVFAGRLVEKKGVSDLLRAVSRLPGSLRQTEVVIIGEGPERSQLEVLASTLGVHAVFTGSLPHNEVREAMSKASVFVGPSKTAADGDAEGFGMVFLEAALSGAPVVAYRHGGVTEAVADGETGLLVEEGSIEQLSVAIARVLTDSALAESLAERGQLRARSRFNLVACTARLEDLYDQVVVSCA